MTILKQSRDKSTSYAFSQLDIGNSWLTIISGFTYRKHRSQIRKEVRKLFMDGWYLSICNQILTSLPGAPDAPPIYCLHGDALENHILGRLLNIDGVGWQSDKDQIGTLNNHDVFILCLECLSFISPFLTSWHRS